MCLIGGEGGEEDELGGHGGEGEYCYERRREEERGF